MTSDLLPSVAYDGENVRASDGERLFVHRWRPSAGPTRAVMILSHGLAEHAGRYGTFVAHFAPRGAAIYAHDHRGFGRSGGRRGHVSRVDRYVDDLRALVERARDENPGLPLVLVGHSMGGTIALLFTLRHPELLGCAVYSAPALILARPTPPRTRLLIRAMSRLYPTFADTRPLDPTLLTHDPELQRQTREDPLRVMRGTARLYVEMFDRAPREILRRAHELRVPFLIVHGTDDPLVSPEGSRRVYEAATVPGRALRLYPGLLHESFNEIERDRVFADVEAWLDTQGVTLTMP